MPRSQGEKENVQMVQELAEVDGPFESPINLNFRDLIKLELPSLCWHKPDSVPKKMKITNTGHTVIISGKWKSERPYLTGGPLDGKYVFSQIHFHWGPDNCRGSEHQVSGESFPLEMHVAHFKTEYMTQEAALREKDGMVVLVYLFKLQKEPNNSLKKIIHALPCVRQANTSIPMENRSILGLCNPFTDDYFMYWGSVVTSTCAHILLWIVCREPFGISREQVEEFRKIMDSSQHPIRRNSREPQPLHKRNVFHVNASRHIDEPLLPIKQIIGCFCDRSGVNADREDSRKSEGDGGCSCNVNCGPQEELEDRQDTDCNQQTGISRGSDMYMQTVYYQHSTVHSLPALSRTPHGDTVEAESESNPREGREISQSCCFLSKEEGKSVRSSREKDYRRKPIDSVTTLTNLIETLETLKIQTYQKLKEIESINHEIRGMKTSCEDLRDRNWLRHAEKVMSRQKRFTLRSSQCCFSELKKLAKECNFDKMDDKMISGGTDGKALILSTPEATDSAFLCSNASGDKTEFTGFDNLTRRPLSVHNPERFSRKAHKLIRSFFEDIKESEETQINLEKNLILKKFEKLSMGSSDQSNASSLDIPPGHVYITKKMMNMGRIRNQFFTEIPPDDKVMTPSQTKMVPSGKKKKKKNKSFFKIRLAGFESENPPQGIKVQKRSLFTRSAFSWLNNRFSTESSSGPMITLRLRDIELMSGAVSSKKSKQSIKSIRKVVSDEHIRTEVSSYMSESFISEVSDKHSKYSRQSRTRVRSIIRELEKSSETGRKSELPLVKFVKDMDDSKFFIQMVNSTNMSSATSTDTERRREKFRKRRSRKDLWEKCSSGMFVKSDSKARADEKGRGKRSNDSGGSTSTDSSSTLQQESKHDVILSCQSSRSGLERSKGKVGGEAQTVNSPRRKKLRVDGRRSHDVDSQIEAVQTELSKTCYVETECQADLSVKPSDEGPILTRSKDKTIGSPIPTPKTSVEKCDCSTNLDFPLVNVNESESQTEKEKELTGKPGLHTMRDTSVEVNIPLPTLLEDTHDKDTGKYMISEASEASLSPRKSSDVMSDPKSFTFHGKNQEYWTTKFPKERSTSKDLLVETGLDETTKGDESSLTTDAERQHVILRSSEMTYIGTNHHMEEPRGRRKTETTQKDSEYTNLFNSEEMDKSVEVSRDGTPNELSECNEYDLQTDSNATTVYNAEKDIPSRDWTPSVPSSEDEKQDGKIPAGASSNVNLHTQRKPFSAYNLNPFKAPYDGKQRKRRPCIRKKSKPLVRKSNAMLRKFSKVWGSNLDIANLTEDEQLKIISANVAKFVKQKLVEHKNSFDFGKLEAINYDGEEWIKSEELQLDDVLDDLVAERKWEKEVKVESEKNQQEEVTSKALVPAIPAPPSPKSPPPAEKVKKDAKKPTSVKSELSPAGEKLEKIDLRKQTLDFVKLNKIMAGKYKRRTPQEKTGGKSGSKRLVKKEEKKEPPKTATAKVKPDGETTKVEVPKPVTPKQFPGTGSGIPVPSPDGTRRGTSLQRGGKSVIPVLQHREPPRPPREPKVNPRLAIAPPTTAVTPRSTPTPPLALHKPIPPKKRLIPTYTLTSYLPAPTEVIEYQQRELDKYLTQTNNITDFFLDDTKDKKYKDKKGRDLSKKNLDYLIMLQKRINHEISANIESSMNYVQTLLSQDYNGTAIIEKAPVKNSLDVFEPGTGGIVLIEMNDQYDLTSESSEESGFYCIYQGRNHREKNRNDKREIIVKRNESGDSGLVDSRLFEELHETDSNYSCEVSILVAPEEDNFSHPKDVTDVLNNYIYHLGGGEELDSCCIAADSCLQDEFFSPKPKKRRDRILDLPVEMKRKILDVLEDEMREPLNAETGSEHTTDVEEDPVAEDTTKNGDEMETVEMISKISEMVKLYLNEYDITQADDNGQYEEGDDDGNDRRESNP